MVSLWLVASLFDQLRLHERSLPLCNLVLLTTCLPTHV